MQRAYIGSHANVYFYCSSMPMQLYDYLHSLSWLELNEIFWNTFLLAYQCKVKISVAL